MFEYRKFVYPGCTCTVLLNVLLAATALAFNPPEDTAAGLTARIDGPSSLDAAGVPLAYSLFLHNTGTQNVSGKALLEVIDDWRVEENTPRPFTLEPGAETALSFSVIPGSGTYNAWYPVHGRVTFSLAGENYEVHPILMVRTSVPGSPPQLSAQPWTPLVVPENGRRSLSRLPLHRVLLEVFGDTPELLPAGWRGTEPRTRAVLHTPGVLALPEPRHALFVHPPWFEGRLGALTLEFPLSLPDSTPIRFSCAIAMQAPMPDEPPSDGATFRVHVSPLDAPDGKKETLLFESHTDKFEWTPISVDLSAYAGTEIRLQLETHPGPRNDLTCDRALWGDPVVLAGNPKTEPAHKNAAPVVLGQIHGEGTSYEVQITSGIRGLLDSRVTFREGSSVLAFDGFCITVLEDALEEMDSVSELVTVSDESTPDKYCIRHHFRGRSGEFDLVGEIRVVDNTALQASFRLENVSEPLPWLYTVIEDASLGPWTQQAHQVYAGVGNVLRNPEAFKLHFDGHQCATSFTGLDFEGGVSVVQAVQAPPTQFVVTPESRIYTFHAPIAPVFTLIPARNVWEGVRVWREINGLQAASGVERLAGRFVFDIWYGQYEKALKDLEQALRYGLSNSVLVWHNWQRWGYDYRLPDILPPNPKYGSAEAFSALSHLCRRHDVVFAPHDNYIDFYPDANEFSFKHIGFSREGQPIWGWFNEGRKAQAFRWRSDAMRPFLEANVLALRELARPNGYFIDVWSSMGPQETWTFDGILQDRLHHRQAWGEAFNWIREVLGEGAPQISESGHDQLIGYLDGAQTNHLRVDASPPPGAESWTIWNIRCEAAERIPWSDMAHHDRFVLHGAGYENRYRGGLRSDLHGIYSDDYIATEVLTGHPGMVDALFGRDVVRKYWLTNALMTALAMKRIATVQFDGDNFHRQHVIWEEAGNVWVNRGESDWQTAGRTLPPFGFYAEAGDIACAVERAEGRLIEWSTAPGIRYVNARPVTFRGVPVSVALDSLEIRDNGAFDVRLMWAVDGPIQEDLVAYVHFMSGGKIVFQADHQPEVPTSQWKDAVITTGHGSIPNYCKPGDEFDLLVGLWLPGEGRRVLRDAVHGDAALHIASVCLEGTGDKVTGFLANPALPDRDPFLARMNPQGLPADFGGIITNGACQILFGENALEILPLPDGGAFDLRLEPSVLPFTLDGPLAMEREDLDGTSATMTLQPQDGAVVVHCESGVFAYRLFPPGVTVPPDPS